MPGPDILYVFTESLSKGTKWGIAIATGLVSGLIVHTAIAATGLGLLIQNNVQLFNVIKYAGAAYLAYLLWNVIKEGAHKPALEVNGLSSGYSFIQLFRTGVIMNILNPKVTLFFLAFFPAFIDPESSNIMLDYFFLGFLFMVQALVIFYSTAVLAGKLNEIVQTATFWKWTHYFRIVVLAGIVVSILLI